MINEEIYRSIAAKACALILTAPAKRSKWAQSALVDCDLLDDLAAELKRAGYDLDLFRESVRKLEDDRQIANIVAQG